MLKCWATRLWHFASLLIMIDRRVKKVLIDISLILHLRMYKFLVVYSTENTAHRTHRFRIIKIYIDFNDIQW